MGYVVEQGINNSVLDNAEKENIEQEINYVSEMINNEYWNWKQYKAIFINTPTGSGKTTFIIEELLQYVIKNNKRMLYLVNRKMLKEQLIKEISEKVARPIRSIGLDISNYIEVMTYQALEQRCRNNWYGMIDLGHYDYIIADESHYFSTDSTYNTNTQISFDWILNQLTKSVIVFMSATIEEIKKHIIDVLDERCAIRGENGVRLDSNRRGYSKEEVLTTKKIIKEYTNIKRRGEFKVHLIGEAESLLEDVKKSEKKWLFFVDNKDIGKDLERKFLKQNIPAVFIASGYEKDEEEQSEVNHIVEKNWFQKKVLIATSVLDNGVSLKDAFLENIVILTDTREEFLQMLGRKRFDLEDNAVVEVYISVRSKEYFTSRLNLINQCQTVLESILKIYTTYTETVRDESNNGLQESVDTLGETGKVEKIIQKTCNMQSCIWSNLYYDRGNSKISAMQSIQAKVLDMVMHSNNVYNNAKKFLFTVGEFCYLNSLSDIQINYLKKFYEKMSVAMENDRFAFAEEQAKWLGLVVTEEMKEEYVQDMVSVRKENIIRYFEGDEQSEMENEILGSQFGKSANIEVKKQIAGDIKDILKVIDYNNDNVTINVGKFDRTISEKDFNVIMELIGLPYRMVKPTKSTFKIVRLQDYQDELKNIAERRGKNIK